ncbi:MAG TPA: hypothetical protein VFA77_09685 [Candidatus Eisenbacteria bacterium]|jgi:hypothetical protein|nr:hypothetical protein [Candidatus Eisenbacteria bacterium]
MSKAELTAEISKLSPQERREVVRFIFDMEEDAEVLRQCDHAANERFLMLDAMEAEDEQTGAA